MRVLYRRGILEIDIELNIGYDPEVTKNAIMNRYLDVASAYHLKENEEIFNPWILEAHPNLVGNLQLKLRQEFYIQLEDDTHVIINTMMDLIPSLLIWISLLILESDGIIADNQMTYNDGDDDYFHTGILTINHFEDSQDNQNVSIILMRTFSFDSKTEKLALTNKDLDNRDFMVRSKDDEHHYDEYSWDLVSPSLY